MLKLEDPPGDYVPQKGQKECTCEKSTVINRKLNGGSLLLTKTDGRKGLYGTDRSPKQ